MRGTKRSPGLHRRRARAAERLGSGGGSGWSSKSDMGLGGNEAGAHGDHDETVGVLGEGLGRRDSDGDLRRPKLEDESMRSSWGVRALGACSRRRNRRWRSLQTTRGGERSMVGVVAANDGGGSLFGRRTKRERGRRVASEGEERGPPGGFVASWWREGEARERLGGSRRWPRRHRRSPPSCFGARGGR